MYDFEGTGDDVRKWRDTGKVLPHLSTRLQNSIAAYDKYIFVFGRNHPYGSYGTFNGIYYMNSETEEWHVGSMAESSKTKLCILISNDVLLSNYMISHTYGN